MESLENWINLDAPVPLVPAILDAVRNGSPEKLPTVGRLSARDEGGEVGHFGTGSGRNKKQIKPKPKQ
jgi:hypothetical protein